MGSLSPSTCSQALQLLTKKALVMLNSWSILSRVSITESTTYHSIGRGDQLKMDCYRLPSTPHGANQTTFSAMMIMLDPKYPNFGRKGIIIDGGNLFCRCCFLVSSYVFLISFFYGIVLFSFSATIFIVIDILFTLLQCHSLLSFFLTCVVYAFTYIQFTC